MATGRTAIRAPSSIPFRAADYLRSEAQIATYMEAMLEDGDARMVPVALRTVAEAVGGMAILAERTGLSRETLCRTLSERGYPRLDTLATILHAFGLRLAVASAARLAKRARGRRRRASVSLRVPHCGSDRFTCDCLAVVASAGPGRRPAERVQRPRSRAQHSSR